MAFKARTNGNESSEMRVLLSAYGARGDVEPTVELGVLPWTLGADARTPAPPSADLPRRATELVAAEFDTVAAVTEGCDAPVATGMIPKGVR
jgi:vancomycin aglycone glucosyltransferase